MQRLTVYMHPIEKSMGQRDPARVREFRLGREKKGRHRNEQRRGEKKSAGVYLGVEHSAGSSANEKLLIFALGLLASTIPLVTLYTCALG